MAEPELELPTWKRALLERKKRQEQEEKVRHAQVEQAKIASLPPWKRAILMREKDVKSGGAKSSAPSATSAAASSLPTTPHKNSTKWQVAVERVKGSDSPILQQKRRRSLSEDKSEDKTAPSTSPKHTPSVVVVTAKPVAKTAVMQRWKHVNSTNLSTEQKPIVEPVKPAPTALVPAPVSQGDEESLLGMPAWKRALILKKRRQQEKPADGYSDLKSKSKVNVGEDEPDSAPTTNTGPPPVATPLQQPEVVQRPEVVNRSEGGEAEAPTQRLVEQEGKTLHAPIYKEVDEWANVKEEDDKFRGLPLWKQALIKRRREDIAKRSGQPVATATPTSKADTAPPLKKAQTQPKKIPAATSLGTSKSAAEQKQRTGLKSGNRNKQSTTTTKAEDLKPVKKAPVGRNRNKQSKAEDLKPVKKAPIAIIGKDFKPARKAPQPPSKKDPMFTYNFSKSTRHSLDTGGSSSDSTDSELEDAVVTNLDESSDEGDSGIVLQHYSASKPPSSSPNLGQKSRSVSSVSSTPVFSTPAKSKKSLRRVSWSDSKLVSEHSYPKYDYSDYDDIEQVAGSGPTGNSGLAQRLHPSLRKNDDSDPYGYGFSSPVSPRSPPAENSLSTFVPKGLSSYSPQILSGYSDLSEEGANDQDDRSLQEVILEEETDDFYADLASNTAALLW